MGVPRRISKEQNDEKKFLGVFQKNFEKIKNKDKEFQKKSKTRVPELNFKF